MSQIVPPYAAEREKTAIGAAGWHPPQGICTKDRRELDLRILMLLSALESWALSFKEPLPEFVADELETVCEALKQEVLK